MQCNNCDCCIIDIVCPVLNEPANGVVSFTEGATMTTATYSCDTGYGLSGGESVRTCSGVDWSGTPPTCQGIVEMISLNGWFNCHCNQQLFIITAHEIDFDSYFILYFPPAIECPELMAPDNALLQFTDITRSYGSSAVFLCSTGYGFSGGDTMLSCEGDSSTPTGVWAGTIPTCQGDALSCNYYALCVHAYVMIYTAIECPPLSAPDNGMLTLTQTNMYGSLATVMCDTGFSLGVGSSVLICAGDGSSPTGQWSDAVPSCEGALNSLFAIA